MAGLDSLIGQPVADLFQQHEQSIVALRALLGNDDPVEDNLMLLRVLIQERGDVSIAEQRSKEGRKLRQKYASVLEMAHVGEHLPQEQKIRECLCFGRWTYPDTQAEHEFPPMTITRTGKSNAQALMQAVTVDELVEYFVWERSRCFADANNKTNATGSLVMMITVNDLEGASLITGREPKFFEAVKVASEIGACIFPLLSRKFVMVNAGRAMETLFKLAGLFLPQRVLDKVAVMTCEELVQACGIPPTSFPDFLGGSCPVPAGSPLTDVSNDDKDDWFKW